MEHLHFLLLNFAVFFAILFIDRKKYRDYIFIGLLALLLDAAFEVIPLSAGIWAYHSEPLLLGISLYTWLLYVPYLGFCYFVSNRLVKHV
ncbi:MAG: hypothetical protein HY518_05655 [Candidatus Aenigmarchaeota archaeon]|nr:hypothetical protein [Candidatus Aenigmarchaeota archaeon]